MAQTSRGVVVELATIHILTIQNVFLAIQSKRASLRPVVSEILHHRKIWTTAGSLVLSSESSPTGLMLIEEVPIDPEVMAAIERLVYSVRGWSTARVCMCSKRGIPINVKRDVRG